MLDAEHRPRAGPADSHAGEPRPPPSPRPSPRAPALDGRARRVPRAQRDLHLLLRAEHRRGLLGVRPARRGAADLPAPGDAVRASAASRACGWCRRSRSGTRDWFSVVTTQLAGNAFNRITPGGGATGTALQANMLADAGFDVAHAATALTVQSVLSTASIVALPVFALPFIVFGHAGAVRPAAGVLDRHPRVPAHGRHRHRGVRRRRAAARPRPRGHVGAAQAPSGTGRRTRSATGCSRVATASGARSGPHWQLALGASLARWLFEYGVLLLARCAVSRPNPTPRWCCSRSWWRRCSGCIPFTPGGLGFVEAGLGGDARGRRDLHRRRTGRDARLPTAHLLVADPARRDRGTVVPPPSPAPRRRHDAAAVRGRRVDVAVTGPTSSRRAGGRWWPTSRGPRG